MNGSYARPGGANGYLAAVFHPTEGKVGNRSLLLLV